MVYNGLRKNIQVELFNTNLLRGFLNRYELFFWHALLVFLISSHFKYKSLIEASSQIHRWEVVRQRNTMKQRETARSKTTPSIQERLIARETFQYVTANPIKYGVVSTHNERQLAKAMDSLHLQQNKVINE